MSRMGTSIETESRLVVAGGGMDGERKGAAKWLQGLRLGVTEVFWL